MRPLCLWSITMLSACAMSARTSTRTPRTAETRELVIPATKASDPPLVLQAAWEQRGDRHCVSRALVTLASASGAIPFEDANLCVTLDPLTVEGDAVVAFPRLGFLEDAGVRTKGRRATIRLVPGSRLESLEVDGRRIRHNPDHYYLFVHYEDKLALGFGNASVSGEGTSATMVLAPQEGLVYVAGTFAAPFFPTGVGSAAIGFSPAGQLVYQPLRPLSDDSGAVDAEIEGHILLAGNVPLAKYPVTVSGEVVVDVDADRDGKSALAGDDRDVRVGVNGGLVLGYEKSGFNFSFKLANASLYYDARPGPIGAIYFAAGDAGGLFAKTPLAMFEPVGGGEIQGWFRDVEDFGIRAELRTKVAGFPLEDTQVSLGPKGIRARGRVRLPADIGAVDVDGTVRADGTFALSGRGDLTVAGLRLSETEVTLGPNGVSVAGSLDLPGLGSTRVSGQIEPSGSFALSGSGDLRPAGLHLTGASVSVSPAGAAVSGDVDIAGTRFAVSGQVVRGGFSLTGQASVDLAVLRGYTEVSITQLGVRTVVHGKVCALKKACVDVAGIEVDSHGRICPIFPVVGKKCVKVL